MRNKKPGTAGVAVFMLAAIAEAATAGTGITARGQSTKTSESQSVADAVKGERIFQDRCEVCHFSASAKKKIGPGLAGLMKREKFENGMKASDKNLQIVIERGGKDMPAFRKVLDDAQARDLIAYMKTL